MSEAAASAARPAGVPYARSLIALERGDFETMRRTVASLYAVAHREAFQAAVDAGAGPVARHRPPNLAVFMGYDFHLTPAGPRLIEINTNAGGALLNGLHTAAIGDPAKLACLCSNLLSVAEMQERIVGTFVAEHAAARGGRPLRRLVIADDRPDAQFLRPEFELFVALFARAGIEAEICDVRDLEGGAAGLVLAGRPVDLVYLRDTDWSLSDARSAVLREAYLADAAVLTPSPREHHLLAHKQRLVLFSSSSRLLALGASPDEAELLAGVVPETLPLAELGGERAWATRREWVFKPEAAFASRAVYRGDKVSRRKLEEIVAAGGFVAQRRVEPGEIEVAHLDGEAASVRSMKYDVRAYAYRDEILLLGARAYQGQVTNLRTPGGGFSAICVVRDPAAEA